jgi:poly-gamma-glutamate capsule biosynthesis protein CapA/YwtB (metallophosphatase superfamily)
VLPHWGTQYTHVAEPIQSLVGRRLVDAGADLVVGGHPHWVQGLERYKGAVIAHSLGNFVFDMDFMEQTMEGATLTATFRGDRLRGVELTPYRLDATFTPRPASGPEARAILRDVRVH